MRKPPKKFIKELTSKTLEKAYNDDPKITNESPSKKLDPSVNFNRNQEENTLKEQFTFKTFPILRMGI